MKEYRPDALVTVLARTVVPVLFSNWTVTPGTPGPLSKPDSKPEFMESRNTISPMDAVASGASDRPAEIWLMSIDEAALPVASIDSVNVTVI